MLESLRCEHGEITSVGTRDNAGDGLKCRHGEISVGTRDNDKDGLRCRHGEITSVGLLLNTRS